MDAGNKKGYGRGGYRANAGRKTNAQRLGRPTSKKSITSFFPLTATTMGNAATSSSSDDVDPTADEDDDKAEIVLAYHEEAEGHKGELTNNPPPATDDSHHHNDGEAEQEPSRGVEEAHVRKFRGRLASTISQINQKDMDKSVAKGILWHKSTLDFVPTAAVAKIDEDCWQSFVLHLALTFSVGGLKK